MLRKIRITLALLFWAAVTLLFLDFTGTIHAWLGWTAKIQFLPALFSLNLGVLVLLLALTLVFGRVYCSVICPLGVLQDMFGRLGRLGRKHRNRYSYSPAISWLRYTMIGIFALAAILGIGSVVALLAPYSSYGRIVSNLFAPVYDWINNIFAYFAERAESYTFYRKEVWIRNIPTFVIAAVTFVAVAVLAWRNGRTYCNTVCPVGTFLGFLAKYSWFKPVIDTSKCVDCGLCGRRCKAACINSKAHEIDYSRCVACFDCLENCSQHAIKYIHPRKSMTMAPNDALVVEGMKEAEPAVAGASQNQVKEAAPDKGRRGFLTGVVAVTAAATLGAQEKKVDGGLAAIVDKKVPRRKTPIVPPGALSLDNLRDRCTGCQLCVSVCPNGVWRPSSDPEHLMQPECSYERGHCRPECTKCSEVCPAGAIREISREEKSSVKIGRAVWVKENCLVTTDGVECGNCARHCPSGAILMVPSVPGDENSPKIPAVNDERCIGCGACEHLCPARPFSAIYVEGIERHKTI